MSFKTILTKKILRKVPEITILFWVIKLLTTAMGESTSDYLVVHINPYLAVITTGVLFAIAILVQLFIKKYIAAVYWFAVVMVAVFGTMVADVMHIVLLVPYWASSTLYAVILAIVFIFWYRTEHTLSIHSITTPRRELFYWATVTATFAMGTAVGDMTAATFALGYLVSGILFAVLFILPAILYFRFRLNGIVAFWISYILTRPLGASFADWFSKPYFGGLGLGDGKISIILTILIIICVGYISLNQKTAKNIK